MDALEESYFTLVDVVAFKVRGSPLFFPAKAGASLTAPFLFAPTTWQDALLEVVTSMSANRISLNLVGVAAAAAAAVEAVAASSSRRPPALTPVLPSLLPCFLASFLPSFVTSSQLI